jgi:hypothetical protein
MLSSRSSLNRVLGYSIVRGLAVPSTYEWLEVDIVNIADSE